MKKLSLQNLVGGQKVISEDLWALSLVRWLGKEHAFLILEGIDNDERYTIKAHLMIKAGSNSTKADIELESVELSDLLYISQHCHSITWNISRHQGIAFRALVEAEKARADEGKINYVMLGKSNIGGSVGSAGSFASSLDQYPSRGAIENLQARVEDNRAKIDLAMKGLNESSRSKFEQFKLNASYISTECLDLLLREGHNCVSWAIVMVQAIQKEYNPGLFKTCVIVNPNTLIDGTVDGDQTRETGCTMF